MQKAKWNYAMKRRDYPAAEKLVPTPTKAEFPALETHEFYLACLAKARGDEAAARAIGETTLEKYEAGVREHPDDPIFHSYLGKLYALLGRKEEAVREAERATELCPESKDAVAASRYQADLAFVCAQNGEIDRAVTLLTRLLTLPDPGDMTLAHLRLGWEWDPLRLDGRFKSLVESPEPQTKY